MISFRRYQRSAGPDTVARGGARFTLITFPIGHLANDWPAAALWILAPAIGLSMGLSPAQVGLLIAIHSAGASLAYFPAGVLSDHVRNRGVLLASTFWWVAIGYYAAADVSSFWLLALLLGIAGLGAAAWHPIATGIMIEQMPGQRAQVLGIHALGGTLAEVGAPLCAGFLLAMFDWRVVLELSVLPAVIMGIVFTRAIPRIPPTREPGVTLSDLAQTLRVWIQPGGLHVIAIVVLYNMAMMGGLSMAALLLQDASGYSLTGAGIVLAAIWLLGALSQPLLGRLSDSAGRKWVAAGVLLIAFVLLVLLVLSKQSLWLTVCLIAAMGSLVGVRAVLLAMMIDLVQRRQTTTLGFAFAMMDGVGALGALFAGMVANYDLRYAFVLAAALSVVAAGATVCYSPEPGPGRGWRAQLEDCSQ
ncbi:MAG: MFS transporter [Gammaproteobacteria bacterium]